MTQKKQIKSKERVAELGEVFTNEREVKAMCDLVDDETSRIDSRFLEPACGDGNFLAEILTRKLAIVKKQYGRYLSDYEKYSFLAVSSMYGVDIMEDNVEECRKRLYDIWFKAYKAIAKKNINKELCKSIEYLFSRNILCGDALTLLDNNGEPIVFSEWSLLGIEVKRRDYTMANLLQTNEYYDLPMIEQQAKTELIPKPVKEYPLVNYRSIYKNG